MNDQSKLPEALLGLFLTWTATVAAWFVAHVGVIAGCFAIAASLFTMMAAHETRKLRKKQQKQLDDE